MADETTNPQPTTEPKRAKRAKKATTAATPTVEATLLPVDGIEGALGGMSLPELQTQLAKEQLTTAVLNRDVAQSDLAKRQGEREQRQIRQERLQQDMERERSMRIAAAKNCNHRQGGNMVMGFAASKGRGSTALNRIILPDGRKLIMCGAGCGLRKFNPHPYDQNPDPRRVYEGHGKYRMETEEEAAARVKQYHADNADFNKLWEQAEVEALTPESAQIMDCGVTMQFIDKKGQQIQLRAPCDSYALKM